MRCVILAIDPGKRSGWCVRVTVDDNTIATSEHATDAKGRSRAVEVAVETSRQTRLPLVIVAESWTRHGRWSHVTQAGISAEWGKWLAAIESADLGSLPRMGRSSAYRGVVRVPSDTWYRALIGPRRITANREQRLQNAMRRAGVGDPDEACARCIAEYAAHASEVAKALPAAFRAASEGAKR